MFVVRSKIVFKEREIRKEDFFFDWHDFNSTALSFYLHYPITLTSEDAEKGKKYLPVLIRIASYCYNLTNKEPKCLICTKRIESNDVDSQSIDSSMIKGLSIG